MKPATASHCAAVALFLVFLGALTSHAVTETDASSGVTNNFDGAITPANLLHNRPIVSTVSPDGFGTSVAPCWITGINDGAASFANNAGFPSGIGVYCVYFGADNNGSGLKNNPQVTISLDTVASPLGYDLTSITSIYGTTNLDRSYSDQKYTVSYSMVTAPNTFIALANVDYHPFPNTKTDYADRDHPTSSQVTLTNLAGATGVAALRFTFSQSGGVGGLDPQGGQYIREIEAFGAPTRAVTETDASSSAETTYDAGITALVASGSDLLAGRPISSSTTPDLSYPITGIDDGQTSPSVSGSASKETFFDNGDLGGTSLASSPVVTINLDTATHPAGYDLTSIVSTYGWQNYDRSWSDQKYSVAYSTVSAPTVFVPLANVDYHPFPNNTTDYADRNNPSSSQVTLANLAGVSGVAALQFTFSPSGGIGGSYPQGGQMIREIQALGTPSMPRGASIDIAPMTWNLGRSDWLNVVTGYGADPTGQADSTAAIQAALDVMNKNHYINTKTIYFPPGTYKISNTLKIANVSGYNLIGCGLNTTIKWYGASGAAMLWTNTVGRCRYTGLVWDGNNLAGCGYEDYSSSGGYGSRIRHENESFRNFNVQGTYIAGKTYPAAAIMSGYNGAQVTGECTIFNCCFYNCATGVYNAVETWQEYAWFIDSCEFENNEVGFDGGNGGTYIVTNTHFSQNSFADIVGGMRLWAQRLTSSNSGQIYIEPGFGSHAVIEDCYVDGWTNPGAAVTFGWGGQDMIMDCTFTNPPMFASAPIHLRTVSARGSFPVNVLSSNNSADAFPSGMFNLSGTSTVVTVPPGALGKSMTSATTTFLKSTWPADSANIIDVTKAPYSADKSGVADTAAKIQSAINAAQAANNGSIVYIPRGLYKILSTLTVTGGNYTIEGEGINSQLTWYAGSSGTMMAVSSPQNITIRNIVLDCLNNVPGNSNYVSTYPVSDPNTIVSIKETSTGASNIIYENVGYFLSYAGNPGACSSNASGPGIVLSGLPAGSTVYAPILESPLTVVDCGPARIFSRMAYFGNITVSGATQPKTGFLGVAFAEGGQQNASMYNINVNDNQNLVLGSYYTEQCANDLNLQRGAGTTTGNVTILGFNSYAGLNSSGTNNPPTNSINVNNYAGRLFYGESQIANDQAAYPVQVVHSGTNAIDLMLAGIYFFQMSPFTVSAGPGANVIMTLNQYGLSGSSTWMADTPNPLTPANLTSISHALDDLRQLGTIDLAMRRVLSPLTVTAVDMTRHMGEANPAFGATATGLINNDTLSSIGLSIGYICTANTGSPPGAYPITPFGAPTTLDYIVTYQPGTLTVTLQIQTIAFGALPAATCGDAPFTLNATASSGLPVSFASDNPAVATVSGSTLTVVGSGTAVITASQAGNSAYTAAPNVMQTLVVSEPPFGASETMAPPMTVSGSDMTLAVKSSVPGRTYQLQTCDDLTSGIWQNSGSPQTGTGSDLLIYIPRNPTVTRRFYRIQLQ